MLDGTAGRRGRARRVRAVRAPPATRRSCSSAPAARCRCASTPPRCSTAEGVAVRVVSMPSWDLFAAQADELPATTCCPPDVPTLVGRGRRHVRLGALGRRLGRHRPLRRVGARATVVLEQARASTSTTSSSARRALLDDSRGARRWTDLHDLYDEHGPEPVARQPQARLPHQRRARQAASTTASAASRRTRRSSRRRSRARPTTTSSSSELAVDDASDRSTTTGRWSLHDINGALDVFAPVYDASDGGDGFVSRRGRARPGPRHRRHRSTAARHLHETIDRPNLYREDPGHRRGRARDPADDQRGPQHQRHADLQPRALRRGASRPTSPGSRRASGDLSARARAWRRSSSAGSTPRSTAGSRRSARPRRSRCAARPRSPRASSPTSCSSETFSGPRWEALAARGAEVQRPLWASTSTKNPAYPDTLYVDKLIGPDTVNTLPEPRSRRSTTTARWPARSTPTSTRPGATVDAARRGRRRHGRRGPDARGRGRGVLREDLRRAPHHAPGESRRDRRPRLT